MSFNETAYKCAIVKDHWKGTMRFTDESLNKGQKLFFLLYEERLSINVACVGYKLLHHEAKFTIVLRVDAETFFLG